MYIFGGSKYLYFLSGVVRKLRHMVVGNEGGSVRLLLVYIGLPSLSTRIQRCIYSPVKKLGPLL